MGGWNGPAGRGKTHLMWMISMNVLNTDRSARCRGFGRTPTALYTPVIYSGRGRGRSNACVDG